MSYGLTCSVVLIVFFTLLLVNLSTSALSISPHVVWDSLVQFDQNNLEHFVITTQLMPRALIAMYVGAVMAVCGAVMQSITRNPLASPATLGVSAGAVLMTLVGIYFFEASTLAQGVLALLGGGIGFLLTLNIAKSVRFGEDEYGLPLILSGALSSMLLLSLCSAILLTDAEKRADYLSWMAGNINHYYAPRLALFWPLGLTGICALMLLSRPLTLISIGVERATALGVSVKRVSSIAVFAVVIAASSAVAICGPVSFVGLVTPHLIRPLTGIHLAKALPLNALTGAGLCLLADTLARVAFAPYVLHTGVLLDLLGGLAFAVIVYHFFLRPKA